MICIYQFFIVSLQTISKTNTTPNRDYVKQYI